jgi:lipopolysaccharide export LptBFGC system permease protein LptF
LFVQFAPAIVTLAVAWSIGRLARDNEITAMRASGISPARIGAPLLIACGVLACMLFVLYELVVTKAHEYTLDERSLLKKKQPTTEVCAKHLYTDDRLGKLFFKRFDVADRVMEGVSWVRPAAADSPQIEVLADRAEWLGGHWWLYNVTLIVSHSGERVPSRLLDKRVMFEWDLPPEYIAERKDPSTMMIGELNHAVWREREIDPAYVLDCRIERHVRLMLPILAVLMLPVTFPFVLTLGERGRRAAAAVGISMMVCFAYFVFFLAMRAVVLKWFNFPPLLWVPNLTYGAVGLIMFLRIR